MRSEIERDARSGVRWTEPRIRSAAARTSASPGMVIFEDATRVSINSHKTKRIGGFARFAAPGTKVIFGLEVGVMWRWVTRGLVLSFVAALATATAFAQVQCGVDASCIGSLDSPDPAAPQSGVILIKGFALAQPDIAKIELFVDDQFVQRVNTGIPMIDVVNA